MGPFNRVVHDDDPKYLDGRIPGYNHVFNNAVSNVNTYFLRTFDSAGIESTDWNQPGNPQSNPFNGIQVGSTAFTYIDDPPVPLVLNGTKPQFVPTRFDHNSPAGTTGIDALGGYLYEWDRYIPPHLAVLVRVRATSLARSTGAIFASKRGPVLEAKLSRDGEYVTHS